MVRLGRVSTVKVHIPAEIESTNALEFSESEIPLAISWKNLKS